MGHILVIPIFGELMKNVFITMLLIIFMSSCARKQTFLQTNDATNFYFTSNKGVLYEYSGGISKISNETVKNFQLENQNLVTASHSGMNILSLNGDILFRHEPGQNIQTSTYNQNNNLFFYVTTNGDLYQYEKFQNKQKRILEKIYPLPAQIIYDHDSNALFFHDKSSVFKLELESLKLELLTKVFIPIQSIALNKRTKDVYFSTSTDGKIYKVNEFSKTIFLIHETVSAQGTSLSMSTTFDKLYFSKTNGRDILINALNLKSKKISEVVTIYRMNRIDQFLIID